MCGRGVGFEVRMYDYSKRKSGDVTNSKKIGAEAAWAWAKRGDFHKSATKIRGSALLTLSRVQSVFENLELYSPPSPCTPLISNPGCFATNTQLLLAPLLPYLSLTQSPTVFGISGYSGAGTKKGSDPKVAPESLKGGVKIYSLTDHIHEREASYRLGSFALNSSSSPVLNSIRSNPFEVNFIPSVAPWFQGILSTLSAPLEKEMRASEIKALYEKMYQGKKLIKVVNEVPEISDIKEKHGVRIGGFQVHSSGKRVVVVVRPLFLFSSALRSRDWWCKRFTQSVLDNLLKGAATQCLQVRLLLFSARLWD